MDDKSLELAKEAMKISVETAKEFAGKLVSPGLEEGGGIIQDTVKFWRFKNQVNILLRAKRFVEEKGLEPQKVLSKILVPLLENGSLEEELSMQDKWSALLANAATSKMVKPSFPEILKQISPLEADLLDKLFDETSKNNTEEEEGRFDYTFDTSEMVLRYKITNDEFRVIADNLFRLNLCQSPSSLGGISVMGEFPLSLRTYKFICFTPLGYQFVKACRFEKINAPD